MMMLQFVDPDESSDWQVISPQTVLNKMRELDAQVSITQNTISRNLAGGSPDDPHAIAYQTGGEDFVARWAAFMGEWRSFYEENRGWLDRFTSGVVTQLRGYIRRYNALEERLAAFGVITPTPTQDEVGGGGVSPMKLVVGGVLVVAGIFGVAWLLRESRSAYETVRPDLPRFQTQRLGPGASLGPMPRASFRGVRRR